MKLMKKILLFGGLGLIVLIIAAVVILSITINSIARKGIEVGANSALGVTTTLKSASIGIFSGKFGLNGLNVANPQGFAGDHFLNLGDAHVAVSLSSLTKDTIELPEFAMDGLDVSLERKAGKSNYQVILDNLEKFTGGGGKPTTKPTEPKKGGEKKLIIKQVTLRNITVHANMVDAGTPGLSDLAAVTVPIPEIKLSNVGQTGSGVGGSGVTVGELSSIIVQAIMAAVVEKGGVLPEQLLGELKGKLAGMGGLKGLGASFVTEAGGSAKALGEQFGAAVTNLGETAKKAVEGLPGADKIKEATDKATDKLKGLIPKKDPPKPAPTGSPAGTSPAAPTGAPPAAPTGTPPAAPTGAPK